MRRFFVAAAFIAVFGLCPRSQGAANGKKLIEWGIDQPSTAFMCEHIAQIVSLRNGVTRLLQSSL